MRALVIAPEPFFTPRGTPFSVYYRTAVTAELGVEVHLLTYGEGRDVELPGVRIFRIPRFRILGDVKIGPSLLKLFLDGFLLLWALVLLLRNRYDFVHAHEEAAFLAWFLKPVFRFKLVYDMHSSLPQQLENFRFTSSRLLVACFRWLERGAARTADAVITICPDLADHATSLGVEPIRHFLIENSLFDPVRVVQSATRSDAAPDAALLAQLPAGAPVVVYAGTLEPYQGIDLLLAAFAKLVSRDPEVVLWVVGGSPAQVEHYASRAERLGIAPRCRFMGRVSQETAQACCLRATVQVSLRTSGTNTPLKVYQQLASGTAILATNVYAHTQVLDDQVAFLCDPDPASVCSALARALQNPELRNRKSEAARRLYLERYSRAAYVAKMSQLLQRLS